MLEKIDNDFYNKYDYIIFDFDDTIINSQDIHKQCYLEAIKSYTNLSENEIDSLLTDINKGPDYFLKNVKNKDKIISKKYNLFEKYKDKITLNKNILRFLNLKIKKGIITNTSRENLNYFLDKFNLNNFFEFTLTRDECKRKQNLKDDCKNKLKKLGKVLYIGDSIEDYEFAKSMNWSFKFI